MRISHCRPPGSDRDIVLMHGIEPNMRWRRFCAELLDIADKLKVDTVVILGALLADTPHTRPVPVSGAAYPSESAKTFGLEETRYEGPPASPGCSRTPVCGPESRRCRSGQRFRLRVTAAQPEGHRGTAAPGRDVLDVEVPLADLPAQAEEWEEAVTEMTAEDEEIAEYVRRSRSAATPRSM